VGRGGACLSKDRERRETEWRRINLPVLSTRMELINHGVDILSSTSLPRFPVEGLLAVQTVACLMTVFCIPGY
jgi:hypothetical protein